VSGSVSDSVSELVEGEARCCPRGVSDEDTPCQGTGRLPAAEVEGGDAEGYAFIEIFAAQSKGGETGLLQVSTKMSWNCF
jgi:hypothetical protein